MAIVISGAPTSTNVVNVLFNNIFEEYAITYTNQATGFAAANIADDETWSSWKPTSVPASVSADVGIARMYNAAGISAHTLGSNGATVRIQYSDDDVTWSNAADYTPLTDEDIFFIFEDTTARYWRVRILNAVANIGVCKIGKRLIFPATVLSGHKPLHHSRKVELLNNTSMTGQFLGNRRLKQSAQTNVNLGLLDRAWVEGTLPTFENHYNNGRTFFYCSDPTNAPKDFGYCRRPQSSDEMNITWEEGDILAQVDFDVEAFVSA